jgi:hypothetical protein
MKITDLVTILGNLSQSLFPVQQLISGFAYVVGILFFSIALFKLHKIGDSRSQSSSHEKMLVPMLYMVVGAALIYLPSTLEVMANTAFGSDNILAYGSFNRFDIYSTMGLLIQTAGLIWFVRGTILITQATHPGAKKEGAKGLVFIIAGILAMNFNNTIAITNAIINYLTTATMSIIK